MDVAISVFAPIFAFMLIPIWIPLVTAMLGAVADGLRPARRTATSVAVESARSRSARARTARSIDGRPTSTAGPGRKLAELSADGSLAA